MARRTASEDAAITRKIQILIDEGIEPKRAQAAAFRMYREGELDHMISKPKRKKVRRRSLTAAALIAYAARRKAARKTKKTVRKRR